MKGTPTQIDSPVVLDRLGTWLVALRVQHWTKSGFCLAALFFHGDAFDHAAWSSVLPLLLMFSLVSSAGYLFNDILNLGEDRLHPRKCSRPIARGAIRTESAWVAILILYAGGMGLGVAIYGFGKTTTAVGCYVLLSLTYSLWLRAVPVVDVLVVAAGFVLRVAAGSYALQTLYPDVYPTPWLLGCTYALALLLGFGKRKGEESLLQHEHQAFGPTRRTLRAYRPRLLNVLAVCSACVAGGAYVMYCLQRPDPLPFVWSAVPVVVGLAGYLRAAWRSSLVEMPESLLLRDPLLLLSVAVWVIMVAYLTNTPAA